MIRKRMIPYLLMILLLVPHTAHGGSNEFKIKVGPSSRQIEIHSEGGFYIEDPIFGNQKINDSKLTMIYQDQNTALLRAGNINKSYDITSGRIINQSLIKYRNKTYRGDFQLVVNQGQLDLINVIDLDEYLKGVIGGEIGNHSDLEVLKIQAIASRNFALANKNKFINRGYNLDDTTASQVYDGINKENANVVKAVESTRGEVLIYNGEIANTIFHATSGGQTENIEDVWGGNGVPYLISIDDPHSINTNNSVWEYRVSQEEMDRIFASDIGQVKALILKDRTDSNRLTSIDVIGSLSTKTYTGNQFRMKMGPTKLKSTNFELGGAGSATSPRTFSYLTKSGLKTSDKLPHVLTSQGIKQMENFQKITSRGIERQDTESIQLTPGDGDYIFTGRGYGHGVGLSQYGAINMVKQGKTYDEILYFYFPGTQLEKWY